MTDSERARLVSRGLRLNCLTIAYTVFEAIASLIAGAGAGSIALVGFGIDSAIEVAASGSAQWRLRTDADARRRAEIERVTARLVGWSFVALAAYVTLERGRALWLREQPDRSIAGVAILALSAIVMPLLARAKRRVAHQMKSRALAGEAAQTSLCAYLSVIALLGVALNAAFGWWWADPIAALGLVPIAREAVSGLRGDVCDDCC